MREKEKKWRRNQEERESEERGMKREKKWTQNIRVYVH